jgi:hypothetical protein
MSASERPTIPAPPISTKELAEEWERRLAETKKENGK